MADRISSLPDEVIYHLLSFLPTKLAATTSILSKRWNPLWLSLFTLNFDDENFRSFKSFRNSVSTVFDSRDSTLPVESFHLKCSDASTRNAHDINRFVYTVAQRKIQNLNLQLSFRVNLPPSIFCCRTLVALHLEKVKINDISHLDVDFPLLKTLRLSYIIVESIDNLLTLLYECPILEELHAEYLTLNNQDLSLGQNAVKKRFPIFPNLIRAKIIATWSNLKRSILNICRPRVQVLGVAFESQLFDRRFSNVTCMELILIKDNHLLCLLESLKYCPKLQHLTIIQDYWPNVEEVVYNWTVPGIIPECFSTQLRTCLIEGWNYTECELQFAMYIMKNSKVMNRMSIKSSFSSVTENVRHQMLMKLISGTRASSTCKLYFIGKC